ncbi:enoyl-CoA hydratase/isomerase family protein [Streptomyces sp. NPDC056296]|uniref:enoyl-CoA hydratase/isomerase family protein n=1 Tax=Streptomyces sp. NPDC056296 TaxID=3345775 RepID=UPI0035DCBB58
MALNTPDAVAHHVSYRADEGVAVIGLHRPGAGNALDTTMRRGLLDAVQRLHGDGDAVRAVLLTAEGKSFCVGQDLKEHAQALGDRPDSAFDSLPHEYNPLVRALHEIPQPVVVAIEGACVGAGLALALCADLRVAAEGARFATAFTGIALAADSGLSATLTQAVGPSRAAGLFLLGDRFTASDALDWGLVHRVVADGRADEEAMTLARRLAHGPTRAYHQVKQLLRGNPGHDLERALASETVAQDLLGATEDHRHAVTAFLERRTPDFQGR